ncbi:LOW QUALITY PROTEIN: testis-specific gene 10 protein [Alca torda]
MVRLIIGGRDLIQMKLNVIEDLKKKHELRQHVIQLLDKRQMVQSQGDRFTCKNYHLCKGLAAIGKLSEQLEKDLLLNTADKELTKAKIQIRHQQNKIKKLEHAVKTLKSVILQTEAEIKQGKSPSRPDTFIKTLEEDRKYYKSEAENLLKVFRNAFSSPQTSTCGSMSKKISSIQAQEEISRLRQEVIKCPRTHRSAVTAQAMLRHVETERDTALSDYRRMTTERDSLREQLKISQETAFNEKAHLEQRIEELENTIKNLDSERLEQMCKVALMKDAIDSLETEMKRLARRALDSETELRRQEAEYASLGLLNKKTEQSLSETQQSLVKKRYEMQLTHKKIMLLDEKIDNFSRQSLAQQEEICALKETIAQLHKENATLQDCLKEGREKIATFEESLAIKENVISDFKILISEMEHSTKKSSEALCIYEKDITSLRQQLQETNKELVQTNKNRESLAQENDRLQEHLSNIKQENQVLYKKLAKYQNELDDMKLKAQDSNTDLVRLKGVLKSKERENSELLENYHKACERGESWEAKCHQAEADCSSIRRALISAESENHRLKEEMVSRETQMEQLFNLLSTALGVPEILFPLGKSEELKGTCMAFKIHYKHINLPSATEAAYKSQTSALSKSLVKMEIKSRLQSKCESSHSEIQLLRKQLVNERASMKNLESLLVCNCEREFQSQIAKQEKDSEIQFLKEQLSLAENKLTMQSQDFTQLRNRAAQLELELDVTKRQLGTEHFERERAVQELQCQNRTISYQLSSTLRTSSPEHSHHQPPDWSLDWSLEG